VLFHIKYAQAVGGEDAQYSGQRQVGVVLVVRRVELTFVE